MTQTSDEAWRPVIEGQGRTVRPSRAELLQLPLHRAALPIACVEGWSTSDQWWRGVHLRDLAALVGYETGADHRPRGAPGAQHQVGGADDVRRTVMRRRVTRRLAVRPHVAARFNSYVHEVPPLTAVLENVMTDRAATPGPEASSH